MLLTLALILAVLWILGFGFSVGGGLIHLVLIVAIIVFLFDYFNRRRL